MFFKMILNIKDGPMKAFLKVLELMKRSPAKINYQMMSLLGEHAIKHSADGKSRGKIVQTFRRMGIDLSKFLKNTERMPALKTPLDDKEIAKGLREFFLPQGANKLRLEAEIKDYNRFLQDFLQDKRSPFATYYAQALKSGGI